MTVTPSPSPGPAPPSPTPSSPAPSGPPKPAAQTISNHWRLGADLDGLRANATTWKTLSTTVGTEKSTFTSKVDTTMAHWKADNGADFSASYATPQGAALTDLSGACSGVHSALTSLAGQLEGVQGQLDASLGRLKAAMPVDEYSVLGVSPVIVFHPEDAEDEKLIQTEIKTAEGLLDDAKDHVSTANGTLNKLPETFTGLKSGWADESGTPSRWTKHPAGSSSYRTVQTIDGVTVVSGTSQSEKVKVEIDPDTGETVLVFYRIDQVDTNPDPDEEEWHYKYTEEQRIRVPAGQQVVLNTGDGNDQVEVPKGVNVQIRVVLGSGDDQVQSREADDRIEAFAGEGDDRVITGHGADFISSGDGDDYVDGGASADQAFGSGGNDVLYGLDGNDTLSGGDGRDYIDGGAGSDLAFGGSGDDQVGGGHDGDDLFGGAGSDHVYGGHGDDHADGGIDFDDKGNVVADDDQLTVGKDDTTSDVEQDKVVILEYNGDLGGFIKVEGSPEFQARVNSDLEFMRSTPTGQEMLRKLTELHEDTDNPWNPFDSDNTYTIKEFDPTRVDDNAFESGGGGGSDVTVTYRPEWTGLDNNDDPNYDITPPVVVLYHEMGHSYQFMSGTDASGMTKEPDGTSDPSLERQNVGLSYSDNDRDRDEEGLPPDTDPDPDQAPYRENALRDELGIPDRTTY